MTDLEAFYAREAAGATAIAPLLPKLREYAGGYRTAVEFGVKNGASSSALLLGLGPDGHLTSYDLVATPRARALKEIAGDQWDYRLEDSRTADVPEAQVFFFDSLHTYDQVAAELAHVTDAARILIFHDVSTFGEVGAKGETGFQSWNYVAGKGSVPAGYWGIRPAIDDFMIRHSESWRIFERIVESHGMLILGRRQ